MMVLYYLHVLVLLMTLNVLISGNPAQVPTDREFQTKTSLGRIDCFPDAEAFYSNFSEQACLARNCIFDNTTTVLTDIPCYLPSNYGYTLQGTEQQIPNGKRLLLTRNQALLSPFPEPIVNVALDVQYYTNEIIRFKLYDADNSRFEVPIPLTPSLGLTSSPLYNFTYTSDSTNDNIVSFSIKRSSSQTALIDTSIGGLVLNNQFLQLVSRLPSPHAYGFGENNHVTLKHNVSARTIWGIFPYDLGVYQFPTTNHYGMHPFYLVMEQVSTSDQTPSGQMHGVLLLNSNAKDYSFGPEPSVTIRTIGGVLDFFVFLGPSPEQVIQQYTWLVGRPMMPPYWALGFQLCRYGYGNLSEMQLVDKRNLDAGVPINVQFADIDYMDATKDFTIDPINYSGLKEYFAQLNAEGIRTIIILDPPFINDLKYYTPTIQGMEQDIFIKWENGTSVKSIGWPGEVFVPDFFKNQTSALWIKLIQDFHRVNLSFDGLWIDMNEPSLFGTNLPIAWNWQTTGSNYSLQCPQNQWEDPPYRTKAVFRFDELWDRPNRLSDRTMCMSTVQGGNTSATGQLYRHYDVHSLFGWSQTKPTLDAVRSITGKRGLVLPRSTFVGSGQWAGHWLGDNAAYWSMLKGSLIGIVEFNWFGIPLVGADICGFDMIGSEELCIRWMQVGAFYPFSRNHRVKGLPDQDPASWNASSTAIMVAALQIRYTLLPYYYTLFYKAHTNGSTVIRPLFHEFPTDRTSLDVYLQFLIGPNIMIAPVTDQGATQVQVYLPSTTWYDYYTGALISTQAQTMTLQAPLNTIPILLRAGAIIPTQNYSMTTNLARTTPFCLIIVPDANGNAAGDLFYDDGETINTIENNVYYYATYSWSSQTYQLTINIVQNNYSQMSNLMLNSLAIYGLSAPPATISVNGEPFSTAMRPQSQIVDVIGLGWPMNSNYPAGSTSSHITISNNVIFYFFVLFTYFMLH